MPVESAITIELIGGGITLSHIVVASFPIEQSSAARFARASAA